MIKPFSERDELVTVFETLDSVFLQMVKSFLEGADIPYLVQGETWSSLYGAGPYKGQSRPFDHKVLMVQKKDAQEASAIIKQLKKDYSKPAEQE